MSIYVCRALIMVYYFIHCSTDVVPRGRPAFLQGMDGVGWGGVTKKQYNMRLIYHLVASRNLLPIEATRI